jgi:hypothetical protein
MAETISRADRLRIEWALWRLNAQLQDLPSRSRRAVRREMRTNLRASAAELGATAAIERLGSLHQLATGYLEAEYADRPQPRWLIGLCWALAIEVVILCSAFVGQFAFMDGVEAGNAHANGTFVWKGLAFLGVGGNVTYTGGEPTAFGLSLNLWMLVYLVAGFVIGGRLWRLTPAWRSSARRRQEASTPAS